MKEQVFINGKPAGWIMPEQADSRQQPKSLAFRLIEERNAKAKANALMEKTFPRTRVPASQILPPKQSSVICGNWDAWDPRQVFNMKGECIGTLMPRATQEELGYGIQGWSRPDYDTRHDAVVNESGQIVSRGSL
jgi:hypothetical protein